MQHGDAVELYYTAEADTQQANLVGSELSVNVPGRLLMNRDSVEGVYGLIVNSKPTTTNGHGYMEGRRFVGVYVDLADVGAGEVDSVRFDTTIGVWIPRLDGAKDDSGFTKFAVYAANNIYTNDSLFVMDRVGIGTLTPDGQLEIKTASPTIYMDATGGQQHAIHFQFDDTSIWRIETQTDSDLVLGRRVGVADLITLDEDAQFIQFFSGDSSFSWTKGRGTVGQVPKIIDAAGNVGWADDATSEGAQADTALAAAVVKDTGNVYFVKVGGDTMAGALAMGGHDLTGAKNIQATGDIGGNNARFYAPLAMFDSIWAGIARATIGVGDTMRFGASVKLFDKDTVLVSEGELEDSLDAYYTKTGVDSILDTLTTASALDDLTDVDTAGYADHKPLVFRDSTTDRWVPGSIDWTYIINEPTFLTENQSITLSGDVTGSGTTSITTTIGTDAVDATMIDWGTGTNQVSASDMPTEDVGDITITDGSWAVENNSHLHHLSTLQSNTGTPTIYYDDGYGADVGGLAAPLDYPYKFLGSFGSGAPFAFAYIDSNAIPAGGIGWGDLNAETKDSIRIGYSGGSTPGYRRSDNGDTVFIFTDNGDTCKFYDDGSGTMVQDCGAGKVVVDSLASLGPIYLVVGNDTAVVTLAFIDSIRAGHFGGGGASALDDLTDVDTAGYANNKPLVWVTSKWQPGNIDWSYISTVSVDSADIAQGVITGWHLKPAFYDTVTLGATAYSWGDHGGEGYVVGPTDSAEIAQGAVTGWHLKDAFHDTVTLGVSAYNWGNHASAGYIKGYNKLKLPVWDAAGVVSDSLVKLIFSYGFTVSDVLENGEVIIQPSVDDSTLQVASDGDRNIRVKAGGITTTQIKDGTIDSADIATGAIWSAHIHDGTVWTTDLKNGATIDTAKVGKGVRTWSGASTTAAGEIVHDATTNKLIYGSGGGDPKPTTVASETYVQGYALPKTLKDLFGFFDRTYFDTLADAGGDSVKVLLSDSTSGGAARAELADDVDTTGTGIAAALDGVRDYADSVTVGAALRDALIKGKLEATAYITPWNWMWTPSVAFNYGAFTPYGVHDTVFELMPTDTTNPTLVGDSQITYVGGHPDYIYIPSGWPRNTGGGSGASYGRWKHIFCTTPVSDWLDEDPYIVVWDDYDSTYKKLYVGCDSIPGQATNSDPTARSGIGFHDSTLHNPVFAERVWDNDMWSIANFSDQNFEMTHDGALLMTFRVDSTSRYVQLWNGWSYDGLTWDTTMIYRGSASSYRPGPLSPTIVCTGEREYAMFSVWPDSIGVLGAKLLRHTAPRYDTVFANPDTCTIAIPAGYQLWHIKVRPLTNQHLFMLAFLADSATSGIGTPNGLFWYESTDGGLKWSMVGTTAFLSNTGSSYNAQLYRGSWVWEMTAQGLCADVIYGASKGLGGSSATRAWRNFRTRCYFYPKPLIGTDTTSAVATRGWATGQFWEDRYQTLDVVPVGAQSVTTLEDSTILSWYQLYGDGTYPDTLMLFCDSTIQASARDQVVLEYAFPYEFDADSLIFFYLTNGAIDTVSIYVPYDTSNDFGKGYRPELADSAYAHYNTGWTQTAYTRVALILDRAFAAGEHVAIVFRNDLADDNDRVWVKAVQIKGSPI